MDIGNKDVKGSSLTKPQACKTCGEIGHTSKECHDEWPHGVSNHPTNGCPTTMVTCFLCEATNHVSTKCQLYPMVQEVRQQVKKGMQQKLRKCVEVQEHKEERKRDTSHITYVTCREQEHHCKEKIGQDTEQNHYQNDIVDQTKVKNEIRVRSLPKTSKRTSKCCYKCEGGHLARNCPHQAR